MTAINWEKIAGIVKENSGEFVCTNCITDEEEVMMNQDQIYLRDVLKSDRRRILYFCDRCGRRLDY